MTERHFHPCDCDECMNANGGLMLTGMGVVHVSPTARRWRSQRKAQARRARARARAGTTCKQSSDIECPAPANHSDKVRTNDELPG